MGTASLQEQRPVGKPNRAPDGGPARGSPTDPGARRSLTDIQTSLRLRLGVMAYLAGVEAADFSELKAALKATQGNLSAHLRTLEDAGYIAIVKSFVNRKPLTAHA